MSNENVMAAFAKAKAEEAAVAQAKAEAAWAKVRHIVVSKRGR